MNKLLIIDDHEVVLDGVKRIFDEPPGTIIFVEAGTIPEALRLAQEQAWDAAILDLSIGGRGGLELLKQLREIRPKLPVVILSMHSEAEYARRALKAGAAGYVTKDSPRDELVKAVRKAVEGGRYLSSALAEKLIVNLQRDTGQPHESLSDREFEVLRLMGSGKTVGEIANLLSLSDKTISTYRARILEKMNMKTNAELMRYAIQNNLSE
jgi:two-component system, NarL family, invasion response regulator UvrY